MTTRFITLTDGNVRHGHIYLREVRDLLPADAIGGGNKSLAGEPVTVVFEPGQTIETDVAGDKMIFRARGAVRDFFARSGLVGGQLIEIERVEARRFAVRPAS